VKLNNGLNLCINTFAKDLYFEPIFEAFNFR